MVQDLHVLTLVHNLTDDYSQAVFRWNVALLLLLVLWSWTLLLAIIELTAATISMSIPLYPHLVLSSRTPTRLLGDLTNPPLSPNLEQPLSNLVRCATHHLAIQERNTLAMIVHLDPETGSLTVVRPLPLSPLDQMLQIARSSLPRRPSHS